ncbi:MAG: hypothetical protein AB7G06_05275 [Bdellovibrionales bacterium]
MFDHRGCQNHRVVGAKTFLCFGAPR